MKHTKADLLQMQSLPLSAKIRMTERRIRDWYEYWDGDVYVSFSGGKDSTVLLDLVRNIYPEIREFIKTFDNVTIIRPKMRFDEVIKKYGYPMISKEVSNTVCGALKGQKQRIEKLTGGGRYENSMYSCAKYKPLMDVDFMISDHCCDVMKKRPAYSYEKTALKKPFMGQLAEESMKRMAAWFNTGCNAYDKKRPQSNPMVFWTDQDILQYIKYKDLPIASVYGNIEYAVEPEQVRWSEVDPALAVFERKETLALTTTGCHRTGCIFCGFGCHLEKEPNRFQRLKETHPRQYKYCIEGGEYNEDGIWQPNKNGLGMGHVFDELNKIYGEDFIKYK